LRLPRLKFRRLKSVPMLNLTGFFYGKNLSVGTDAGAFPRLESALRLKFGHSQAEGLDSNPRPRICLSFVWSIFCAGAVCGSGARCSGASAPPHRAADSRACSLGWAGRVRLYKFGAARY
jgi:hypothetical protein